MRPQGVPGFKQAWQAALAETGVSQPPMLSGLRRGSSDLSAAIRTGRL